VFLDKWQRFSAAIATNEETGAPEGRPIIARRFQRRESGETKTASRRDA
jgi:hypothetical protein